MRILLLFTLFTLLTACSADREYYLQTADARGLEEGADVYRQGIKIGTVSEVAFAGQDVKITIQTDGPLYADQRYRISRGDNDEAVVIFDQPESVAAELADGATLVKEEFDFFEEDFGLELEKGIESIFGKDGEKLGAKIEEIFGKDGEKLEAKFEEIFGKDGEKLEAKFEEVFGKDGEKLEAQFEEIFGKDGEKLEAKLEEMFGKDGEKLEAMAEAFGAEFEELGNRIEEIDRRYEKDSPEWKREMKKAVREWTESKE